MCTCAGSRAGRRPQRTGADGGIHVGCLLRCCCGGPLLADHHRVPVLVAVEVHCRGCGEGWRAAGGCGSGGRWQAAAAGAGGRAADRSQVLHCPLRCFLSPRKATGRGSAARGRQWTAALQWGARAPHRSAATDSGTATLLTGDGCGGRRRGTVSELSGGRGGGWRAAQRNTAGADSAMTAAPRPESGASSHAPDAHSRARVGQA